MQNKQGVLSNTSVPFCVVTVDDELAKCRLKRRD